MYCPRCHGKVVVKDTVHTTNNKILRERKCTSCGHFFYTTERITDVNEEFHKTWNRNHRKNYARNGVR